MNLRENPFHLLGATTRDSRRRIMQLAEDRALMMDSDVCAKARADLTNPRQRVSVEVSWLPGVDPESCTNLVRDLATASAVRANGLPPLAMANLAASALAITTTSMPVGAAVEWIVTLATAHDETDPEEVFDAINEDRAAAEMPEVLQQDLVEEAIAEQRRFYVAAVRTALDRMPTRQLVETVTAIVDRTTGKGRQHAPLLVDQFVDSYEVDAARFLELESVAVGQLLGALTSAAKKGAQRATLDRLIERIEQVVRNWDAVAQPIQLSAMARGIDHTPSIQLVNRVRSTAVDLHNEHAMLWAARRLTSMLRAVFAEVPRVVEFLDNDIATLDRMANVPSNAALLAELMRQGKLR
ncbi:MAG: hypothetical protein QM767_19930 [Anaeromyxobacter sp.]